jgi:hypothetical protein
MISPIDDDDETPNELSSSEDMLCFSNDVFTIVVVVVVVVVVAALVLVLVVLVAVGDRDEDRDEDRDGTSSVSVDSTVVAGSMEMTRGVGPPVFVDADCIAVLVI